MTESEYRANRAYALYKIEAAAECLDRGCGHDAARLFRRRARRMATRRYMLEIGTGWKRLFDDMLSICAAGARSVAKEQPRRKARVPLLAAAGIF